MKLMIGVLLVASALAAAAAGAARADVPPLSAGGWCGASSDAGCQATMLYVECADGNVWLVDPSLMDAASFGEAICGGDFAVLQPAAAVPTLGSDDATTAPPAPVTTITGGVDVGFGAATGTAPDPTQYTTEVQCPDGSIWAVATGDDFVCPAA